MIRRIIGTVDGSEIALTADPAGLWKATVPAKPNGEYAAALWAEDEAGNRSYFCTLLLSYDITQLCCRVRVLDVGASFSSRGVAALFGAPTVRVAARVRPLRVTAAVRGAEMKVVRCRNCGR